MANPAYDLIAVDLDGTLLDSAHALPESNRAALRRAHDAGLKIVLCTGRSYTETRPVLDALGLDLDATCTVFGALLTDVRSGATIERTPMAPEVVRAATAWLAERGHSALWLYDPNQTGYDGCFLPGPRCHPAYYRWLEKTPCRVRQPAAPPEHPGDVLRLTVVDERDTLEALAHEFAAAFGRQLTHNILRAPSYDIVLIEIFAPQCSKWYGIEKLCRRWGIPPDRTVAIGDDVNDLAMLRHAGLGIAMGNAVPAARAAAAWVTLSNDQGGVAAAIDRLLAPPLSRPA